MTLTTKILLFLFGIVVVGVSGFVVYKTHEMSVRQDAIEKQVVAQQQLADNITRSMAQWTTKADLAQFAKDNQVNLDTINDNLGKLNASLSAINVSSTHSNGQVASNLASTQVVPNTNPSEPTVECNGTQIPCPNADPFHYQANEQVLALDEQFGQLKVPFGTVGFSAAQQLPWNINIAPRQYNSVTVLGTDENQRTYAYNKFTIHVNDKDYEVPVTTSEIKQIYPEPKFSLFNPRLFFGVDAGIDFAAPPKPAVIPNLTVQVMSYGRYKNQPDFSILQIGAGYDINSLKPTALIAPIEYNVGQHIPLMTNLFIGPALQISPDGNFKATIGAHVGF